MIIYRAYLDYGPYNGESDLGYFESIASAYNAISNSCKERRLSLDRPTSEPGKTIYKALDYDGTSWCCDYKYIIKSIEVKP